MNPGLQQGTRPTDVQIKIPQGSAFISLTLRDRSVPPPYGSILEHRTFNVQHPTAKPGTGKRRAENQNLRGCNKEAQRLTKREGLYPSVLPPSRNDFSRPGGIWSDEGRSIVKNQDLADVFWVSRDVLGVSLMDFCKL